MWAVGEVLLTGTEAVVCKICTPVGIQGPYSCGTQLHMELNVCNLARVEAVKGVL